MILLFSYAIEGGSSNVYFPPDRLYHLRHTDTRRI